MRTIRPFLTPRFWLFALGGAGALFVIYVMIAAAVQTTAPRPGAQAASEAAALKAPGDRFLQGEMADFEFAKTVRLAPDAPFQREGEEMTLADYRGKTVLVNFWATWCAPCLRELPSLDQLEGELGSEGFEVVAVAADPRGPNAAAEFLEKLEINHLKLYADPQLRLAVSLGGEAVLPVSILYNARGEEVGRLVGEADWASAEARQLVEAVIAGEI